jgi:hypothetical protein
MDLASDESTSSFEIVDGWIQFPRYGLKIPEFKPPRCLAWREEDGERCGLSVPGEASCWASLGLEVIGSRLWEEEQLKPVFEEIADTFLCCEHKAQMKMIAEIIWQDAWRSGWITEYRLENKNKAVARRERSFYYGLRARLNTSFGRLKALIFRSRPKLTDPQKEMPADRRSRRRPFARRTRRGKIGIKSHY